MQLSNSFNLCILSSQLSAFHCHCHFKPQSQCEGEIRAKRAREREGDEKIRMSTGATRVIRAITGTCLWISIGKDKITSMGNECGIWPKKSEHFQEDFLGTMHIL